MPSDEVLLARSEEQVGWCSGLGRCQFVHTENRRRHQGGCLHSGKSLAMPEHFQSLKKPRLGVLLPCASDDFLGRDSGKTWLPGSLSAAEGGHLCFCKQHVRAARAALSSQSRIPILAHLVRRKRMSREQEMMLRPKIIASSSSCRKFETRACRAAGSAFRVNFLWKCVLSRA